MQFNKMTLFDKIKSRIKYEFLRQIKPEMIGQKSDGQQHRLRDTNISNISHLSYPQNISLGDNVFIGHFNYIDGFDGIKIGRGCQITNFVSILTHSSHNALRLYGEKYPLFWGTKMKGLRWGRVEIGDYSFVGPHSVIMPGTVIGKGCIIGAYSFVDGKVEDYSVIRGNPAAVVGDTRQIDDKLLAEFPELGAFYYDKKEKNQPA